MEFSVKPIEAMPSMPIGFVRQTGEDRFDRDFARGGKAIQDPSEGLNVQRWVAFAEGEKIWLYPELDFDSKTLLVTETDDVTEVQLAFDTLMRPFLAYVVDDLAKLRWFDTEVNDMVITEYPDVVSPFLFHDDVRQPVVDLGGTDIVFSYILGKALKMRLQRDRFEVEYHLADIGIDSQRIIAAGMTESLRLRFDIGRRVR